MPACGHDAELVDQDAMRLEARVDLVLGKDRKVDVSLDQHLLERRRSRVDQIHPQSRVMVEELDDARGERRAEELRRDPDLRRSGLQASDGVEVDRKSTRLNSS